VVDNFLNDRLEICLGYAVELEALAIGDPQGVIAIPIGEGIEGKVKLRQNHPRWGTGAEHHGKGRVGLLVPVPLLVGAMEFQNLHRITAKGRTGVFNLRGECPPQKFTPFLNPFFP
jgi:hypothetical protein